MVAELSHKEKGDACKEAYKNLNVDALHKKWDEAHKIAEEAHMAYLEARDAYHKIYRKIWNG